MQKYYENTYYEFTCIQTPLANTRITDYINNDEKVHELVDILNTS